MKESNIITFDKQIFDLEVNLSTLKNNLVYLEKDKTHSLKKAQDDLENLDLGSNSSKSSLELKKLEDSIEKLEFDYDSKLVSDAETIK
jgi:hypothetical protein